MFDVAIPLVVELVLSTSYILPPSSSPASFVLVFLLIFFLAFSLRLPFLTVILLLECPIHFFCLVFIVRMRDLSSPIVSNISSFVLCSVQLTYSILLQVHISKASSLFISSFLIVHVSAPYSTTHGDRTKW